MILERINQPNDIKNLNWNELEVLAAEIREFLVQKVSENGGHLASNLGVVELTIAMHMAYDLPKDKMIWDVGHQAYTHKILTGRKEGFDTLFADLSEVIARLSGEMRRGVATACPNPAKKTSPCDYCNYNAVCRVSKTGEKGDADGT